MPSTNKSIINKFLTDFEEDMLFIKDSKYREFNRSMREALNVLRQYANIKYAKKKPGSDGTKKAKFLYKSIPGIHRSDVEGVVLYIISRFDMRSLYGLKYTKGVGFGGKTLRLARFVITLKNLGLLEYKKDMEVLRFLNDYVKVPSKQDLCRVMREHDYSQDAEAPDYYEDKYPLDWRKADIERVKKGIEEMVFKRQCWFHDFTNGYIDCNFRDFIEYEIAAENCIEADNSNCHVLGKDADEWEIYIDNLLENRNSKHTNH